MSRPTTEYGKLLRQRSVEQASEKELLARLIDRLERLERRDPTPPPAPLPSRSNEPPRNDPQAGMGELIERMERALGTIVDKTSSRPPQVIRGGGVAPSEVHVKDADGNRISPASDAALAAIKRGLTDFETRMDYEARTDSNPVYVGKAAQGSLTSNAVWTVQRLSYDSSGRLTRAEVREDVAWDDRTVGW